MSPIKAGSSLFGISAFIAFIQVLGIFKAKHIEFLLFSSNRKVYKIYWNLFFPMTVPVAASCYFKSDLDVVFQVFFYSFLGALLLAANPEYRSGEWYWKHRFWEMYRDLPDNGQVSGEYLRSVETDQIKFILFSAFHYVVAVLVFWKVHG
jgi:hypothetical protein